MHINLLIILILFISCNDDKTNSSANKVSTQTSESIAVVSKAKGDISYKKNLDKESKETLKTGSDLYNKDYINTGNNGFLKYVYVDDGTQVKIHNNSEVYVMGQLNRKSIMKQLEINEGTVKLKVEKQGIDEFTVITPTSVASVKGTSFWINCYGDDGDKFYGESGLVSVLNKKSGKKVDLKANKVLSSLPQGNIETRDMTSNDFETIGEYEKQEQPSNNKTDNSNQDDSNQDKSNQGGFNINPQKLIKDMKDKSND